MTEATSPGLNKPTREQWEAENAVLRRALKDAADHFDNIASRAENWRAVVERNPIAEARWSGIRNHARHRAAEARATLAKVRKP